MDALIDELKKITDQSVDRFFNEQRQKALQHGQTKIKNIQHMKQGLIQDIVRQIDTKDQFDWILSNELALNPDKKLQIDLIITLTLIPKSQHTGDAIASTVKSVYDPNNSITYDFSEDTYKTIIVALLSKMAATHPNHPTINQILEQTRPLNRTTFNKTLFTTPQYRVTTPQNTQDMNYHIIDRYNRIDHLISTEDIANNPDDDGVAWYDLALLQNIDNLLAYTWKKNHLEKT